MKEKLGERLLKHGIVQDKNKGAFPILYSDGSPILVFEVNKDNKGSKIFMILDGTVRRFFSYRYL